MSLNEFTFKRWIFFFHSHRFFCKRMSWNQIFRNSQWCRWPKFLFTEPKKGSSGIWKVWAGATRSHIILLCTLSMSCVQASLGFFIYLHKCTFSFVSWHFEFVGKLSQQETGNSLLQKKIITLCTQIACHASYFTKTPTGALLVMMC